MPFGTDRDGQRRTGNFTRSIRATPWPRWSWLLRWHEDLGGDLGSQEKSFAIGTRRTKWIYEAGRHRIDEALRRDIAAGAVELLLSAT